MEDKSGKDQLYVSKRALLVAPFVLPKLIEEAQEANNLELLNKWLEEVREKKEAFWAKIVESGETPSQLFGKGISIEEFKNVVDIYYPIYEAVHRKYEIRPQVTMVLHARETTFSTHPFSERPSRWPYGCMQIHGRFYSEDWRKEAIVGWKHLEGIDTTRVTDPTQIMAAGRYLIERWKDRGENWDVESMRSYKSQEDGDRVKMARHLIAITGS